MPLSLREKLKQASQVNLAHNAAKTARKLTIMEQSERGAIVNFDKPTHSTTQQPTHQPFQLPSSQPESLPTNPVDYPVNQAPTIPPTVPTTVREDYGVAYPEAFAKAHPVNHPAENEDIWTTLTTAQQHVLAYLAGHGGEIIRYAGIATETGLPVGTVQTIFKRFKKLGILTSHYGSRGTVKGMWFSLNKSALEKAYPVAYPKDYPGDHPPTNHPSRLPTIPPTQSPTQSIGNVLIDREKNLSISLPVLRTTWPRLAKTGFGVEQLQQIMENLLAVGKPTDRIVQSLDHIEYELAHGQMVDKEGQAVTDPCSWAFRALAQNGYYRRPKGYVSSMEQALLDQEEEARAVLAAQKKAEQARFEAWQASLTPQELDDMLRDHPGGPKDAWLRHIWKERGEK